MALAAFHSDILTEIFIRVINENDSFKDKLTSVYHLIKLESINKKFKTVISKLWIKLWQRDLDDIIVGDRKKYITIISKLVKYNRYEDIILVACRNGCNKIIGRFLPFC